MDQYFTPACEATLKGMRQGTGGPFGATLVRDGEIVCAVGNTVVKDMDPTGHAEVAAVREGCRILGTLDLSDCVMYATCEPCPMCVGAMMLAGIRTCYYASTDEDATEAGFPVDHLRAHLDGSDTTALEMVHVTDGRSDCAEIWTEFEKLSKND